MLPHERKKQRETEKKLNSQKLSCKRQAAFRKKQRDSGLDTLQVRLSTFSHAKASVISDTDSVELTRIYDFAIKTASLNNPPAKHEEILEGDLIGTRQISPWLSEATIYKFEQLAKHYISRNVAMSAIVNAYCDHVTASYE